ncbi:hypothetical protein OLX02_02365 [Novosphingobium sp. KCTC 2891]|uniref:hypothetical protein n=1 Tax=Novosphingobium sp. KCTC 2891 TaxID=2989730 RepID=UPI002223C33E|nr:hypothetical protein [Novosphingobium sp. KCTC 2891]MCW1381659.1 hypothetical protein [Novosphingobium sp. KCTC 2891]
MTATPSETNLHIWRSRTIDAFASIEIRIEGLLSKIDRSGKCDRLGAKIEALRKTSPQGPYSAARKAAVDKVLEQISKLLPLRNDLVHSPMLVRKDAGKSVAVFSNPNALCDFSTVTREFEAPRLQALACKASHLAKELDKAIAIKAELPTEATENA